MFRLGGTNTLVFMFPLAQSVSVRIMIKLLTHTQSFNEKASQALPSLFILHNHSSSETLNTECGAYIYPSKGNQMVWLAGLFVRLVQCRVVSGEVVAGAETSGGGE